MRRIRSFFSATIILLLALSCSEEDKTQNSQIAGEKMPPAEAPVIQEAKKDHQGSEEVGDKLKQYQDSVGALSKKSVLDYYYLLPGDPFFDREVGDDGFEARKAGLKKQNIRNGYLIGGHEHGPSFAMALFRGAEKDLLLLSRVQSVGEMFHGFFKLLEFKGGEWIPVPSDMLTAADKYRKENEGQFKEDENVVPIIPEKGTTVKFIKCYLGSYPVVLEGELLFSYSWDKRKFSLNNIKE